MQVQLSSLNILDQIVSKLYIGQDPLGLYFDVSQLRPHLLACLERGCIEPFPSQQIERGEESKGVRQIKIFCTCRTQEGGKMLECCTCYEWFHEEYLQVLIKGSR